jgi:hypothetical protein
MPWNAKTDGGRKCAGQGDSDYVAAQRACGKYLHGEEGDLSAKLEKALTSGWSIEALKAYAFSIWQQSASDDVTEAAWRLAVEFADSDGCSGGRNFLKRFSVNPERYLVRSTVQRREVMSEHSETRSPCLLSSPLRGQRTTSR